jgi:urea transport system substrate-binding protein
MSGSTVKVGILHALSGTMAISETPLKDAAMMAIAEINATGGVLGKQIEPTIQDGESTAMGFALKAKKLIEQDRVAALFGCWSSSCRKAILPIVEKHNSQLWYPLQYEGLESSQNIFYTGMCANQQIEPAVRWLVGQGKKRLYLLGSDYVFPRTANKIVKATAKQLGGAIVAEEYLPLGEQQCAAAIAHIQQQQPDAVLSTLNGDTNLAFYQQYGQAGISAEEIPILAVSLAETSLQQIGDAAAGHYAAWSYFQSLDTPENHRFVSNFRDRYGSDRVTSDPVESAYTQVYLWKQAVEAAGSCQVEKVREAVGGQKLLAPNGWVRLHDNHHVEKTCRIGQIRNDGQFDIVCTSERPIEPLPFLGADRHDRSFTPVVVDLLGEVSHSIQYSCQLEEKSRQLETANAELQAKNEQLQATQEQLLRSQKRFREFQNRQELLRHRLYYQIRCSLDLDTVLKTAVQEIRLLLNIDICQFIWYERDENNQILRFRHAVSDSIQQPPPNCDLLEQHPDIANILLNNYCLQIDDLNAAKVLKEPTQQAFLQSGIKSLLVTSIRPNCSQDGLILCQHSQQVRPWEVDEIELMLELREQLAIAIDHAHLYRQSRESEIAATSQAQRLSQVLQELQDKQAQLIQAEKMSSLGQMVAGMAHEINNPVNFISGNLTYVQNYFYDLLNLIQTYQKYCNFPEPEIQQQLEEIDLDFITSDFPEIIQSMKSGTDRIQQLVQSLKRFSHLDEADNKAVNLHYGIDSTLEILQHRLQGKPTRPDIQVVREYGDLPVVECYPGQMNQVYLNLISNAIDAIDAWLEKTNDRDRMQRVPKIRISTEQPSENFVLVRIADNGIGISPDIKKRLFDPFFTTKPVGSGTGLGLSICYQIVVQRHQGQIWCSSTPGHGSEFWLEIPIKNRSHNGELETNSEHFSNWFS